MGVPMVALMAAQAAVSTYGAYRSARLQEKAARSNARMAKWQAQDARARGQYEEQVQRQKTSALMGRQRAAIGASGAAVDVGSAADVVADTAAMGELDALMVRANAAREAYGYNALATNYKTEGKFAKESKIFGTAGTALGGAAQTIGAGKQAGVIK